MSPTLSSLYEDYADYVHNSLRRLGVHRSDLDDLVHDVFLRVNVLLEKFDPQRPAKPWLFAICARVASEYRRRKTSVSSDTGGNDGEPLERHLTLVDSETPVSRIHARNLVARALKAIHEDRRPVFVLYELDDQPMSDIANALGIPLHTAYSRLRVAREEFAAAVEAHSATNPGVAHAS